MEDLKAVVGHSTSPCDEQLSKLHLGVFQGFIVTTKEDGMVPLNSRVVATVEKGAEEALIDYLAEHDLLREQVRELVAALEEIKQTVGPSCGPGDWPKLHNVALSARSALSKVKAS